MKLHIVRHGETNYNVLGLNNADPSIDVHLTPQGIAQAQQLAKKLRHENLDAIYVSELPRTRQTAEHINHFHHLPIIIDKRLNDINTGFEGQNVSEYHALRSTATDPFTYKPPQGESSQEVFSRTQTFLNDLRNTDYQNILIITSKHNFRHFQNIIDNLDPRQSLGRHINNTAILTREIN